MDRQDNIDFVNSAIELLTRKSEPRWELNILLENEKNIYYRLKQSYYSDADMAWLEWLKSYVKLYLTTSSINGKDAVQLFPSYKKRNSTKTFQHLLKF